ncbi:E3 ubiquitin-protein ligase RNF180-like isoform X1 [Neolamprologus brichardi]|uniref:Ring finger protein 180b n=1 Tax=Neolamprologus brichardi TaxID=32507 RepID=A0A3Q4N6P3_NEOBR|nr:E3 ubiquitin-protein ligase RNF180-like isoform X1 [Neolamprologus brichardi]XP_035769151.1 E3 ubiquitin-protein ligase RNF180-like isoform X1 [Neolamprologus brichardi]
MKDPLQENVQRSMLRCRKCRKSVIDSICLLTIPDTDEASADVCSIWHLDVDTLPDWILISVHQTQWTAGKLNCQNCRARLGGFNFINRSQCPCGTDASIHFSKSRLDYDHKHSILIGQPLRSRLNRGQMGVSQNHEERAEFSMITLDRFQDFNCAATMPHESPMEASNPQTDGQTPVERENALWKSVPASRGRDFYPDVVSHSASEQLHTDVEASSSVSEGTQPPLDQHLLLTEEGVESSVETAALCNEVSDPAVFLRRRWISDSVSEHEEEPVPQTSVGSPPSNSLSKREKNHMKSVRRKQRRRERWLQHQKEKALAERVRVLLLDDDDDEEEDEDEEEEEHQENRENLTCAVCLDVYFSPHRSQACGHVFCEPCLRAHAMNSGNDKTICPLCWDVILYTNLQTELDQRAKTLFPKLYKARKREFEASPCALWPLPEGIRDEDFPVLHFYGVQLGHILLKIFFVISCILCFFLVLVFLCFILFLYCFRPYCPIPPFFPD